jgi:hypothetical protein
VVSGDGSKEVGERETEERKTIGREQKKKGERVSGAIMAKRPKRRGAGKKEREEGG